MRAFHTLLRCRARVALPGVPPAWLASTARCEGSLVPLLDWSSWLVGWVWWDGKAGVDLVAWDPHGPTLVDDALEIKMALPFMLNGLRAKGSADALINSKNSMWPVSEFSRSHIFATIGCVSVCGRTVCRLQPACSVSREVRECPRMRPIKMNKQWVGVCPNECSRLASVFY